MKNQKGFTLIELLLVLAIIGIISAIAVPAMLGQRENARQKATEAAAGAIKAEIATYAEGLRKQGIAPTGAGVLAALTTQAAYTTPSAKNAYIPTLSPYVAATATANGEVGLVAGTATGPDAQTYNVINVSYKHVAGSGTAPVAIDQ